MKRIVLILAMICATIANASAQEILKEVKRLEKQAETFANDTTKNINERKIACFKYDAIFYLIDNDKFITQFSLDTDWVKALEAVTK